MADKKIVDLDLRSDFDGTVNLPGDDTSQTWRVTGAQILAYIKANFGGGAGSNGQFLRWVSGAPAWTHPVVQSETTTATMALVSDILKASTAGGAWTLTVQSAVTAGAGRIIKIQKTTADAAALTLGGTGMTATTLNTQGETLTYYSDGTNWVLLERFIPSILTSWTPSTTWVSNVTFTGRWWRVGQWFHGLWHGAVTGAPTNTALNITLPLSLAIDTTAFLGTATQLGDCGTFSMLDANGSSYSNQGIVYVSSTQVECRKFTVSGSNIIDSGLGSTSPFTWANGDSLRGIIRVPISGWNS